MMMFNFMDISASALTAEKTRIDIIAKNLANANTTRATGGMPYRRQMPVFKEHTVNSFSRILNSKINRSNFEGVKISRIVEDQSPFRTIYEPGHPDADENGYLKTSNVDVVKEMVDMISAQRAYDSNITAINTSKAMMTKALEIGRR
ncbi:MAG: flagellar basal body rod protein FlgC [Tissierellia bacterium]|nr:flagellar basal body rod protein FlgC [Tissierellia bacterium]